MTRKAMWPLLLLIVVGINNGSKIDFTTTPSDIVEGVTQTFTMSCSIKDTTSNDTFKTDSDFIATSENVDIVNSIIIRKVHGDSQSDVARIVTGHDAVASPYFSIDKLSGNMTQGQQDNRKYLTVTWNLPGQNLSGQYTCEINAVNLEGDTLKFTSHSSSNSTTATVQDLIALVEQARQDVSNIAATVQHLIGLVAQTRQEFTNTTSTIQDLNALVAQTRQEMNNRPEVHYEDGVVYCVDPNGWDVLLDNKDYRVKYVEVKFTRAYQYIPQINLSFRNVYAYLPGSTNFNYWAILKSNTTEEFTIECGTWQDSYLKGIFVRWTSTGI